MAKIGYDKLDTNGLQNLLKNLSHQFKLAVFQTVTDSFFEEFELNDDKLNTIPLKDIERCRVFGTGCEARWILREDMFHTTVLCEEETVFDSIKDQLQDEVLELEDKDEHPVLLWGERDINAKDAEKFWFEGRIPQKLRYPLENKGSRIKLTVAVYCEENNWNSKFYRFKEISNV